MVVQSQLKAMRRPTERGWAIEGGGEGGGGDAKFNNRKKKLKLDQIIGHQIPQDLTLDNSLW